MTSYLFTHIAHLDFSYGNLNNRQFLQTRANINSRYVDETLKD